MSGEHKMGHVQPMRNYVLTLLALLILTGITVGISIITPSLIVAMVVAGFKATLVALFFMHGKYEGKDVWSFIIYPFAILAILLVAIYGDYYTGASRTDKTNYLANPSSLVDRAHHGDEHGGDSHGAAGDHGESHDAAGDHGEKKDDQPAEAKDAAKEGGDQGNEGDH